MARHFAWGLLPQRGAINGGLDMLVLVDNGHVVILVEQ